MVSLRINDLQSFTVHRAQKTSTRSPNTGNMILEELAQIISQHTAIEGYSFKTRCQLRKFNLKAKPFWFVILGKKKREFAISNIHLKQ